MGFKTRDAAKKAIYDLPDYFPQALECAVNAWNSGDLNEFKKHLIGPPDTETFTGACAWLVKNYKKLDLCIIESFTEKGEK